MVTARSSYVLWRVGSDTELDPPISIFAMLLIFSYGTSNPGVWLLLLCVEVRAGPLASKHLVSHPGAYKPVTLGEILQLSKL